MLNLLIGLSFLFSLYGQEQITDQEFLAQYKGRRIIVSAKTSLDFALKHEQIHSNSDLDLESSTSETPIFLTKLQGGKLDPEDIKFLRLLEQRSNKKPIVFILPDEVKEDKKQKETEPFTKRLVLNYLPSTARTLWHYSCMVGAAYYYREHGVSKNTAIAYVIFNLATTIVMMFKYQTFFNLYGRFSNWSYQQFMSTTFAQNLEKWATQQNALLKRKGINSYATQTIVELGWGGYIKLKGFNAIKFASARGDLVFGFILTYILSGINRLMIGPIGENAYFEGHSGLLLFVNTLQGLLVYGGVQGSISHLYNTGRLTKHQAYWIALIIGELSMLTGWLPELGHQLIYLAITAPAILYSWHKFMDLQARYPIPVYKKIVATCETQTEKIKKLFRPPEQTILLQ